MSVRQAARQHGLSVSNLAYWLGRAKAVRLERMDFSNRKSGRASNRTSVALENRILSLRRELRYESVLGEYGAEAIRYALEREGFVQIPSPATINRVLSRHGALDAARRQRRMAPPKGWYLPHVAAGEAELDSFDLIEELKIANGPLLWMLTAISLHGGLPGAWVLDKPSARGVLERLLQHWAIAGLPAYAQFDNDTLFQGAHHYPDTVGRVSRACLALGVVPVFAAPLEHGFQNLIESFNALWQVKVWQRFRCLDGGQLQQVSDRYVAARRARNLARLDTAPVRRSFPQGFKLDLTAKLSGTIIFLRRTDDSGRARVLGRTFQVSHQWTNRLVRCEVDFTHTHIRFFALRRRDPHNHPLLAEVMYPFPNKPFKDRA
jgi:hypothetical protein